MLLNTLRAILKEAESGEPESMERIQHLVQGLLKYVRRGK